MMTAWLGALVGQELIFGQRLHEVAYIGCGLLHVIEVIG
jgi:hypothetical protein